MFEDLSPAEQVTLISIFQRRRFPAFELFINFLVGLIYSVINRRPVRPYETALGSDYVSNTVDHQQIEYSYLISFISFHHSFDSGESCEVLSA